MKMSVCIDPKRYVFPDPESIQDEDGLLCVSEYLDTDLLLEAYQRGIFPWPQKGVKEILWFSPLERGVLFFDEIHVSKSLKKSYRRLLNDPSYEFKFNTQVEKVISECAKMPRPGQSGTWITDRMHEQYSKLASLGIVQTVELFKNSELVAGIYGVKMESYFSGESMFGLESDLSKLVLLKLCEELKQEGYRFLDIQMVTPVMKNLGGRLIPRAAFLKLISAI
jgi:leucyl/phenylalanyl-tRNA--protein transferase